MWVGSITKLSIRKVFKLCQFTLVYMFAISMSGTYLFPRYSLIGNGYTYIVLEKPIPLYKGANL